MAEAFREAEGKMTYAGEVTAVGDFGDGEVRFPTGAQVVLSLLFVCGRIPVSLACWSASGRPGR
ncbi:MAG TPA: hypothetical protein PKM57_14090, partial [Kiritimatiellia bacterium]|nr:hypothetical protein [Kiritimatiellia bacterium]HPS09228.1 hypothetical protein [Kiritimatiellia bacterium]